MSKRPASLSLGSRARVALAAQPRLYHAARRATELARYALRKPHEPEFAAFGLFPDSTGLFLDIGANSGASALSFRIYNKLSPILSIEANPFHRSDLEQLKRLLQGFDYRLAAAAEHPGELTLWVPFFGSTPLTGEASTDRETAEDSYWLQLHAGRQAARSRVEPVTVPAIRLDDLDLAPDFIKIDVEGAEVHALNGLHETIKRWRPIMLIEVGVRSDVVEFASTLGYRPYRYVARERRIRPYEGGPAQNLLFIPADRDPSC